MPNSLVNCIYQDRQGFIWTGTEYGLARFDGITFTVFHHHADDSTSLQNNYVRTVFESSDGRLFVGTITGLQQYDRATGRFNAVPLLQNNETVETHVITIVELDSGDLWLTTSGRGLFVLPRGAAAARFEAAASAQLSSNYLNRMHKDSAGYLWIGTESHGLNRYSLQGGQVKTFRTVEGLPGGVVSSIAEDHEGNLFVGVLTKGLYRYDRARERFTPVASGASPPLLVYSLLVDSSDRLLIGTDGQGLKYYDRSQDAIRDHEVAAMPFDGRQGKVHAILQDRAGDIWLGMFQKGVVHLPAEQSRFTYYGYKSVTHNIIGSSCVTSIVKDRQQTLWIGTDNDGLYGLRETGGEVRHFTQTASTQSVPDIIQCVFEDSDGALWLGSYARGLAQVNRQTGACRYIERLAGEQVYCLAEDDRKRLLIGTFGSGFFAMDLRSGAMEHYESSKREDHNPLADEPGNDWVNALLCDREGLIWIGHYQGVSCFDPVHKTFLRYPQGNNLLPGHIVNALYEDSRGDIYIGTTMQLFRFDKDSATMHLVFPEAWRDGKLSPSEKGDMVCSITEDRDSCLWFSSYNGLCKLNPATREWTRYYAGDGLQMNEFTRGAVFRDKDGKLYFGGNNGVCSFYPHEVIGMARNATLHLTGFYLFNRPVRKGDRSGRHEILSAPREFRLAHNDNTFTLEFSTLDFVHAGKTVYEYKVEGRQPGWSRTSPGNNRITYNNLPPGRYAITVRVQNSPGSQQTYHILLSPPWYWTWWAKGVYGLLLLLLAAGVVVFVRARIYYRQELLEREHARQIDEARLQFFINISHEIRTPMTLILTPLEKLMATQNDPRTQQTYLIIYRNAKRILRLVNQLMDVRKLEKGLMRLGCRETDMVGFLNDLMQTFEFAAASRGIRFTFEHAMDKLPVWVDLSNFDKVMLNVLSNAFKFTPDKEGEIIVRLSTGSGDSRLSVKEYFEIRVIDNGEGVEPENIERIFDRFYQAPQSQPPTATGTGIGLHLSRQLVELHHGRIYAEPRTDQQPGVQFVIRLPLGNAHLRENEMETPEAAARRVAMYGPTGEPPHLPSAVDAPLPEEPDPELPPVKAKTRYKVMIVDDEDDLRRYIKQELSASFRITDCSNGKDALEKLLQEGDYHVVVSDVVMPKMDGLALTRKIKQNTRINHLPVILLSAKDQDEDYLLGLSSSADAYLCKPFRPEILQETIYAMIANRALLRTKFSGQQDYDDKITRAPLKSPDEALMNKVTKLISDNLGKPGLNVAFLADKVGMSRVHMHRKLKELTNQSARDFIRGVRIKQAAQMLLEQKLGVADIAYTVGFNNVSHFSTAFKDCFGMSPSEYIEKHEESPLTPEGGTGQGKKNKQ